jgi:hypothetical protein
MGKDTARFIFIISGPFLLTCRKGVFFKLYFSEILSHLTLLLEVHHEYITTWF